MRPNQLQKQRLLLQLNQLQKAETTEPGAEARTAEPATEAEITEPGTQAETEDPTDDMNDTVTDNIDPNEYDSDVEDVQVDPNESDTEVENVPGTDVEVTVPIEPDNEEDNVDRVNQRVRKNQMYLIQIWATWIQMILQIM